MTVDINLLKHVCWPILWTLKIVVLIKRRKATNLLHNCNMLFIRKELSKQQTICVFFVVRTVSFAFASTFNFLTDEAVRYTRNMSVISVYTDASVSVPISFDFYVAFSVGYYFPSSWLPSCCTLTDTCLRSSNRF